MQHIPNSSEAILWSLLAKKLSNEATQDEITELQVLLLHNPDLQYQAELIAQMWNQPSEQKNTEAEAAYLRHLVNHKEEFFIEPKTEPSYDEIFPEKQHSRNNLFKNKILIWSSLLVVAFSAFFYFTRNKKMPQPLAEAVSSVATKNGNRSKIVLPDGSTVWLNAGSKLEYDHSFGNMIREVRLTGEAFFDVVKNPQKPFIVKTHAANIKVLGTTFNVRSYPTDNKIETSLIRGSVEVTLDKRPNEKWVLKPNEKLVLLNEYLKSSARVNSEPVKLKFAKEPVIAIKRLTYQVGETVAVEAAWTRNKLSFEDESFLEVAQKMERWYDVKFVFKNKEHEELSLHGSFTSETINQAMEALQYIFKFRYEIKNKEVTIY